MTKVQFERELLYQSAMSALRAMHGERLLTDGELARADDILREKYRPVIGALYPIIPLTS